MHLSPGATMSFNEKLNIARHLSNMGVDVCEAGFPISSPGDFESVSAVAKEVGPLMENGRTAPMTIAALSRSNKQDIDCAFEAIRHAPSHRIHTFLTLG